MRKLLCPKRYRVMTMHTLSNTKYLIVREGHNGLNVHVFSNGKEVEVVPLNKYAALNLIKDLSQKLGQSV